MKIDFKISTILIVAFVVFSILFTTNECSGQNNKVYAMSLRELIKEDSTFNPDLNYYLGCYFDIKPDVVLKDETMKKQLIISFIREVENHGYKFPEKIVNADPFEPYSFIIDMNIPFDRLGYIIEADKFYEQIKGTGKKIGDHQEKTVFHHEVNID